MQLVLPMRRSYSEFKLPSSYYSEIHVTDENLAGVPEWDPFWDGDTSKTPPVPWDGADTIIKAYNVNGDGYLSDVQLTLEWDFADVLLTPDGKYWPRIYGLGLDWNYHIIYNPDATSTNFPATHGLSPLGYKFANHFHGRGDFSMIGTPDTDTEYEVDAENCPTFFGKKIKVKAKKDLESPHPLDVYSALNFELKIGEYWTYGGIYDSSSGERA